MIRRERVEHFQDTPKVPTNESTFEVIWNAFGQLHLIDMDEQSLIEVCEKHGCEDPGTARAHIKRMVNFEYLNRRIGDDNQTILYSRGRLSPKRWGVLYH